MGQRFSTTLSLISTLHEVGWSTPRSSHFTPRKETRYPFYRKLSGPLSRSGIVGKISPPPQLEPELSGPYRFTVPPTRTLLRLS